MSKHIHKRFSEKEVIEIIEKFINKELELKHALILLKIGKTRFYSLLKDYQNENFSLKYQRSKSTRSIGEKAETLILNELGKEKKLIDDKNIAINDYNYSFIKNVLGTKYGIDVSLPTIIDRAKKMNFVLRKR